MFLGILNSLPISFGVKQWISGVDFPVHTKNCETGLVYSEMYSISILIDIPIWTPETNTTNMIQR